MFILTLPKCKEEFTDQICKFTDQKKKIQSITSGCKGSFGQCKNKNTLKYDYFSGFILCLKHA